MSARPGGRPRPMSAIDERLRDRAVVSPAMPAVVACAPGDTVVWTWAELDAVTAGIAARLAATATRPHRSVLLVNAGNHARALPELVGALRTDLPVMVVAEAAPEAELSALREDLTRGGYDTVSLDAR